MIHVTHSYVVNVKRVTGGNMVLGQRRKYEDGKTIVHNNNGIKVMIHKDCITISANDREGMSILNTLGYLEKVLINSNNVNIVRDGVGDIHLIELYYDIECSQNIPMFMTSEHYGEDE